MPFGYFWKHFKHVKKDGLYQQCNEKGIFEKEGQFKDGYKNGVWKSLNANDGRLLSVITFSNSLKNGITKIYNEANRVAEEGTYKNDAKDGVWKVYNLAGKLIQEIDYQLGKELSSKTFK